MSLDADVSASESRGCTSPGRHPQADTLPQEDTITPPPETASATDGTHPTGMHLCVLHQSEESNNHLSPSTHF